MKNRIFDVDIKGLRQLQSVKPKWFIIRELLQNAIDEEITTCSINMQYKHGKAHITVTDDSPTGFRDLADSYTLFKDTYKRSDVKKRGRFNFGEKQVLCLADYARILSTKGGMEFEILKGKRTTLRNKRETGSEIYVVVRMSKEEYNECENYCLNILVPQNIKVSIKSNKSYVQLLSYQQPHKIIKTKLLTEVKRDNVMKIVLSETEVHIYNGLQIKYIYEMGIPICEIDCDYGIDVQQKVPLSADRDKVDSKYLKTLFAEVLNNVAEEITPEQSSSLWVRNGFTSTRATKEARKKIVTKRFGDKVLIANPMDKNSMDDAITNNYNVVYGAEMNKEEWNVIKEDELMVSTSQMFKRGKAAGEMVVPNEQQKLIALFVKKVASQFLNINVTVLFYKSSDATVNADFDSDSKTLRFNLSHLPDAIWQPENNHIQQELLDLIIHELAHNAGLHYEQAYHKCLTMLASKLTIKALNNPEWFKL